jgi:phage-related minor tail protein
VQQAVAVGQPLIVELPAVAHKRAAVARQATGNGSAALCSHYCSGVAHFGEAGGAGDGGMRGGGGGCEREANGMWRRSGRSGEGRVRKG